MDNVQDLDILMGHLGELQVFIPVTLEEITKKARSIVFCQAITFPFNNKDKVYHRYVSSRLYNLAVNRKSIH